MDWKTMLDTAIWQNSHDEVERILSEYDDEAQRIKDSTDGLFLAVGNKQLQMVNVLTKAGAKINARKKPGGLTVLHLAIKQNDLAMARLLLEKGANVDQKSQHDMAPLHTAVETEREELVRLLLDGNADVTATKFSRSALHLAVERSNLRLAELLLDRGCPVNAAGADGATALHLAVEAGRLDVLQLLLARGADTSPRKFGESALRLAVRRGWREAAEALLRRPRDQHCAEQEHCRDQLEAAELALRNDDRPTLHCLLEHGQLPADQRISALLQRLIRAKYYEGLRLLLGRGAAAAPVADAALQLALQLREPEAACLLLDAGASAEGIRQHGGSALQLAFHAERLDLVQLLMARGARPGPAHGYGRRPLEVAISRGWLQVARDLLAQQPAEANGQGFDGASVLCHALRSRDSRLVRLLLDAGADPQQAGRDPRSRPPLLLALELRLEEPILRGLLDAGASPQAHDPLTGMNALQLAVVLGLETSAKLLLERGALPNDVLADGSTALLLGLDKCKQGMVRLLLEQGADPRPRRPGCQSPLRRAISLDWQQEVRMMLQAGAADGFSSRELMAPLRYAVAKGDKPMFAQLLRLGAEPRMQPQSGGSTLLHVAASRHCSDIVDELLAHGLRLDAMDRRSHEGLTPLHVSLICGNERTAMLLLDRGASVLLRERFSKRTPLHLAAASGCCRVAVRLLDQQVISVDDQAAHGQTPLQAAVISGQYRSVIVLARYGANLNLIIDDEHCSPLHSAICHRKKKVLKVLLAAGAKGFGCTCHSHRASTGHSPFGYARRSNAPARIQYLLLQYEPPTARQFVRQEMLEHLRNYNLQLLTPLADLYVKHMARTLPALSPQQLRRWPAVLRTRYEQALLEIQQLRNTPFYEDVCYGILLDCEFGEIGIFMCNEELVKAFSPKYCKTRYPLYGRLLAHRFKRAYRLEMLHVAAGLMLVDNFQLPMEVSRMIVDQLHYNDLRNLKYMNGDPDSDTDSDSDSDADTEPSLQIRHI